MPFRILGSFGYPSSSSSSGNTGDSNNNNNNNQQSRSTTSAYPGMRISTPSDSASATGSVAGNHYINSTTVINSNISSSSNSNNTPYAPAPSSTASRSHNHSNNHSNSNNHNNLGVGIGVASNPSRGLFSSINSTFMSSRTDPYVQSPTAQSNASASHGHGHSPSVLIQGSNITRSSPSSATFSSSMPTLPHRSNVFSSHANSNRNSSTSGNNNRNSNSNNNSNSNSNNSVPFIDNSVAASGQSMDQPGAYSVTRTAPPSGSSQIYRVTVPPGVTPGNEFTVHAGTRRVRVVCPVSSRPGQPLQITLPPEPVTSRRHLVAAPLTRACRDSSIVGNTNGNNNNNNNGPSNTTKQQPVDPFLRLDDAIGTGGAVEMSPEVIAVNRAATSNGQTARTYLVNIPNGINPGDKFRAKVDGQQFEVTCPPNASSGMKVRIVAPAVGIQPESNDEHKEPLADPKLQVFEVIVPNGVRPNQPFTLMANGQRVLVTCPPNVYPGSKIRFQLPVPLDTKKSKAKTRLAYKDNSGSSGWERTIRLKDMKFQWVRMEDEGDNEIDTNKRMPSVKSIKTLANMETFDFGKAAYVRKIQYLEGNDARMRTGSVTLVPAQEGVVDSKYVDKNYHGSNEGRTLLSYTDIESVQSQCLDKKIEWFRKSICEDLFRPWEQGHVKIVVQRHALLRDSVDAVLALGRDDMRKRWRIEFLGEPGIEAGGLTREWFQLVTEQIFDPDFGLWQSSENNQMSMNINPASHVSCPDDYLKFFRFLGRVMGRALFDGQLIKGHMARYIYKHLLGWPITFDDLEAQDEEYYNSLKKLTTMKEDVSLMCLGFTVTEETLGVKKEIEMVPGGSATEVDSENLPQYLEASLKYRMLNRCKPQITELMLGFFDIIPEPALTVFDPNELELILCGLPTIDMDDWINNTGYSGYYEAQGKRNRVVKWFWEVVRHDFDQEMKARLLQFVTGTSGVPPRGFSVLQGNDGNLKKFSINGVSRDQYAYPRAHTCFNRIDLPNYSSKQELREKVSQAVSMTYVGFDIE